MDVPQTPAIPGANGFSLQREASSLKELSTWCGHTISELGGNDEVHSPILRIVRVAMAMIGYIFAETTLRLLTAIDELRGEAPSLEPPAQTSLQIGRPALRRAVVGPPLEVIPVPGDGDCLFHSFFRSMQEPELRDHLLERGLWQEVSSPAEAVRRLRSKVITWIRTHLETDRQLRAALRSSIQDYVVAKRQQSLRTLSSYQAMMGAIEHENAIAQQGSRRILEEELPLLAQMESDPLSQNSINTYLDQAIQPGFAVGKACMLALHRLYGVGIWVRQTYNGIPSSTGPRCVYGPECDIRVGLEHVDGNHFDALILRAQSRG